MTTTEMVALVTQRTKVSDATKIVRELNSALRWVARRVYNTADGPDLLVTVGQELATLVATTRDYDLGTAFTTAVAGTELMGVKLLWVKLPSDTIFRPMISADSNSQEFVDKDSAATATPDIAVGHPILYNVINFSKVRFAPALPSGAVVRADVFRIPPALSTSSNDAQANGDDLPSIFHDSIVHKANAQIFSGLDDSREGAEETRARDTINDAIFASRRTQAPQRTTGWRAKRRRM